MKAFLSTPRFVEDLTHICELVLQAPDDKLRFLKSQLRRINDKLPATAYVPILSNGHRHAMALRIVEEESRVFVTNTKAPYLVCIETFLPNELELVI